MSLNFFDQFMSPTFLSIPLIFIALSFPLLLLPPIMNQWLGSRMQSLQLWFSHSFIKQLTSPLNIPNFIWSIMLMALMFLLISINLLGLLPYTFTPTTQLSLNLGFAVPLWSATILMGLRNKPAKTLGHLLPEGTPTLLIPMLIVIETISQFIRPLALGVRLTANLTAGHLLIQLVSTATLTLMSSMPTVAMLTTVLLFLLTLLEIAVAMIQAYVFVLLLSLYLQENI